MPISLNIPNYKIVETLYEGAETFVFRAIPLFPIDEKNQPATVILKVSESFENLFKMKAIFNHEFNLLTKLKKANLPGIVTVYEIKEFDNRAILVIEDVGKTIAKRIEEEKKIPISQFFEMAIQICEIITAIHKEGIVHKDIKPDNIAINEQNNFLKIIDFNISSLLVREREGNINSKTLAGSLPYMSPEQTGRLNRDVDYRADYYSLGITFYQMLTGELPFDGQEPMDFIHAHLAINPRPPHEVNDKIPLFLSAIILKLMEKDPDDRYQSTNALIGDLNRCYEVFKVNGSFEGLYPTKENISGKLKIPEKLYGRENKIEYLLSIYESASTGPMEMLLVKGPSGIGKTSLINEIQGPIIKKKGIFLKGKYDQFKRDIPYATIRDAFQQLTKHLMVLKDETFQKIKIDLEASVGPFSRVITDVIPELLPLLGEHPPVEELAPALSINRFNFQMMRLFQTLCRQDTPIVMFIDDLQWADTASLSLIRKTLKSDLISHFLFIGAYRDNEVSPQHPLVRVFDEIAETKGEEWVREILIDPLPQSSISSLILDMFKRPDEEAKDLVQFFEQKTKGNPFFIHELLKKLYADELINFLPDKGIWQFEIDKILAQEISDDIVEMMVQKIKLLPEKTQKLLSFGASIGNEFSLNVLSIVSEKSHQYILSELWDAILGGVLFPIGADFKIMQGKLYQDFYQNESDESYKGLSISYKFVHDRIQQAAYALIPPEEREAVHLGVARILNSKLLDKEREDKFFDIVNHYNVAFNLLVDKDEIDFVKKINIMACEKSMKAQAFGPSLQFIRNVMDKYNDTNLKDDYDRVIQNYKLRVRAEYLNGNFEIAEKIGQEVLPHCKTKSDKVDIYIDLIQLTGLISKDKQATIYGLKALSIYGINEFLFSRKPRFIFVLLWTAFRLRKFDPDKIHELPEITDFDMKKILEIASTVAPCAYLYSSELTIIMFLRVITRTLPYGISVDSPFYLATFGACSAVFLNQLEKCRKLYDASERVNERFPSEKARCRLYQILGYFSFNTYYHPEKVKDYLLKGMMSGLNSGDYIYASFNYGSCGTTHAVINNSMIESEKINERALQLAKELKNKDMTWITKAALSLARCLQGKSKSVTSLDNEEIQFNEEGSYQELVCHEKNFPTYSLVLGSRIQRSLIFNEYKKTLKLAGSINDYIFVQIGGCNPYFYQWCMAVSMMGLLHEEKVGFLTRIIYIMRVAFYVGWNSLYYKYNPQNWGGHFHMICAAFYALLSNKVKKHYHLLKSISFSRKNSQWKILGFACEHLAYSYFRERKHQLGLKYIKDSIVAFSSFGAHAKVRLLKEEFGSLSDESKSFGQNSHKQHTKNATIKTSSTTIKNLSTTINSQSVGGESDGYLDMQSALKFSQILAGEIHLEKLLRLLIDVLMKNTGAEKVFIIRDEKENVVNEENLCIDAEAKTGGETQIFHRVKLNTLSHLSQKVVNSVYRGKGQVEIILSDATKSDEFSDDPYILKQKPKSILCLPIMSKGKLKAILYLENNLSTNVFSNERLSMLKILTGQLAVSMENALLYENLEEKVKERTEKLKEAQKQVVDLAHQSGMADIASGVTHNIGNILPRIYMNIEEMALQIPQREEKVLQKIGEKVSLLFKGLSSPENEKIVKGHGLLHEKLKNQVINLNNLIEKLKNNIDQITNIVSNQKKYAHTQKAFKTELSLRLSIQEILKKYKELLKGITVNIKIENIKEEKIFIEKHKYLFALDEVIRNAGEKLANSSQSSDKIVDIELKIEKDHFITLISDNGDPMDSNVLQNIFHSGFSTKEKHGGMGLHDSYNFIYSIGGSISLNNLSKEGQVGVCVEIKTPIEPNLSEKEEKNLKLVA